MEDKTFELLTKMYSDINNRFDGLEKEIQHVGNQVTHLEYEHSKKLDVLFDGYKQIYEKQQEHDKKFDNVNKQLDDIEMNLDDLSLRVSRHDSKLEVLEGGRKK